ncbi:MAG: FtsX-like permease family protein [Pirellulales bacterium]
MPLKLLLSEVRYRLGGALLTLLAIAVAAGLFVAGPTLLASYARQTRDEIAAHEAATKAELAKLDDITREIMLRLSFNVRIVHRDTDVTSLLTDYAAVDMPQEYLERLAHSAKITKLAHLSGTLIHPITLDNRKRMLIGFAPEAEQPHEAEKKPIVLEIAPDSVILGHEAGRGRKPGESVGLLGREFRVAKVLDKRDSHDDLMVALALADAQEILGKQGRINAILAISCRCKTNDRIGEIAEQVAEVLPDVHVTESGTQAGVRTAQRAAVKRMRDDETERLAATREQGEQSLSTLVGTVTPLVVLVTAIWIGVLAWSNVAARRTEIGLLRALGKGSAWIAGLFLGKAVLLGILGGAIGAALGWWGAHIWAQTYYAATAEQIAAPMYVIAAAVVGAPVVAALATYLPTLVAIMQDPAVVLREA